jgi:hypothetical protein
MGPIDLAQEYLEIFFSGTKLERLYSIFDENLEFCGPFVHSNTAKEYIESLVQDPPAGLSYKIISEYENKSNACIIYRFSKVGIDVLMCQEFYVTDSKITKMNLIFDTGKFA